MITVALCILMTCIMFNCDAVTYKQQLDHIAKRRQESRGVQPIQSRRQYNNQMSVILGAPSLPSHLPEAEPILPGHTLIRPARGMLKSSIKFPHMELDNGAGVYGNVNNLGIRYDGRNDRVQYSGFRRTPENLIVAVQKSMEPQYTLSSFLELSDRSDEFKDGSLKRLEIPKPKDIKGVIIEIQPPKSFKKRNNKQTRSFKKRQKSQDSYKYFLPESYNEQMFKKIVTKKPKKKRFRLLKKQPRHFLIEDESMRRERQTGEEGKGTPLFSPNDEDSSSDYYMETESEDKKEVSKEAQSKMEWFWKSKDAYNNIKINQDAPELSDLMPAAAKEKIRQWWFYHQDDFMPFEE